MELTVEAGCLLWGMRVIVPKHLQQLVPKELHLSYPGDSHCYGHCAASVAIITVGMVSKVMLELLLFPVSVLVVKIIQDLID